jgi:hypothetical protein
MALLVICLAPFAHCVQIDWAFVVAAAVAAARPCVRKRSLLCVKRDLYIHKEVVPGVVVVAES